MAYVAMRSCINKIPFVWLDTLVLIRLQLSRKSVCVCAFFLHLQFNPSAWWRFVPPDPRDSQTKTPLPPILTPPHFGSPAKALQAGPEMVRTSANNSNLIPAKERDWSWLPQEPSCFSCPEQKPGTTWHNLPCTEPPLQIRNKNCLIAAKHTLSQSRVWNNLKASSMRW